MTEYSPESNQDFNCAITIDTNHSLMKTTPQSLDDIDEEKTNLSIENENNSNVFNTDQQKKTGKIRFKSLLTIDYVNYDQSRSSLLEIQCQDDIHH